MNTKWAALPVLLLSFCAPCSAQVVIESVRASVTFGIGIKHAERQPDVDYEVIQPTGDRSTAHAVAPYDGERPGHVSYPGDFTNAGTHRGTYRWVAKVDGKVIASGEFEYLPAENAYLVRVPWQPFP